MGALVKSDLFDGRLKGLVGVFNGTSTNALKTNRQGIYTARLDVNPLVTFIFRDLEGRPSWLVLAERSTTRTRLMARLRHCIRHRHANQYRRTHVLLRPQPGG